MALTEYGIWDEKAGGFIETQLYSKEQAEARFTDYADTGDKEYLDMLHVLAICPDHEEQPADSCEEC